MREAKRTVQNMHLDILNKALRCANIQQGAGQRGRIMGRHERTEGVMISRSLVFLGLIIGFVATEIADVGTAGAQQSLNPSDAMTQMLRRELDRRAPQPLPAPPPQVKEDLSKWGIPADQIIDNRPGLTPEQVETYWRGRQRQLLEQQRQYKEQQQALQRLYEQELRSPPPMSCTTRSLGGGDFITDCF
jgi:hypothetical protein